MFHDKKERDKEFAIFTLNKTGNDVVWMPVEYTWSDLEEN